MKNEIQWLDFNLISKYGDPVSVVVYVLYTITISVAGEPPQNPLLK